MPIIELAKALKAHPLVEVWATDPAACGDLKAFAGATGHLLEALDEAPALIRAVVRRAPRPLR